MVVPALPKVTDTLLDNKDKTTAAIGGNPNATMSGAQMAAGLPKPAAPSRKLPSNQAMIMA